MKLIYQPKGKANEYCKWAVNLYNGCSNKCEYCYNRHSQGKNLLGKDEPTLKAGLKDNKEALALFKKEFDKSKDKIMKDGGELFFNFVSDPFLDETWALNVRCIKYVLDSSEAIVRSLTKCPKNLLKCNCVSPTKRWKIGFTLTGCDWLENDADSTRERIKAIRILTAKGFDTWASIEPVIRITNSFECIYSAYMAGCRQFKIGLLSGKHLFAEQYTKDRLTQFIHAINSLYKKDCDIQWKESVQLFLDKTNEAK